ncbi:hypothetical protein BDR04DRAFT_1117194 [Suillus decipiens]|nr:hypothetical protein BDR04DRAFT_1117194 [Suillus decipiens]
MCLLPDKGHRQQLSLNKHTRTHEGQPLVSHHQSTPAATKTTIPVEQVLERLDDKINGHNASQQLKAAIVPVPLAQGQLTEEPTLKRTRAARDVSPMVEEKQLRNMPAPREWLLRKAKVAKLTLSHLMVNGQWSMVNGHQSMVNSHWSTVNGHQSSVNSQWSEVK